MACRLSHSMANAQWPMFNGQRLFVSDQWSMVDGQWSSQWSMVDGQWSVLW